MLATQSAIEAITIPKNVTKTVGSPNRNRYNQVMECCNCKDPLQEVFVDSHEGKMVGFCGAQIPFPPSGGEHHCPGETIVLDGNQAPCPSTWRTHHFYIGLVRSTGIEPVLPGTQPGTPNQ